MFKEKFSHDKVMPQNHSTSGTPTRIIKMLFLSLLFFSFRIHRGEVENMVFR